MHKNRRFLASQKSKISVKSLFIEFIGDSPTIRVLDYLMTERDLDFSITDMARNAGVGRTTLYRIWQNLRDNKIIIPTRIIGRYRLYKLNKDNIKIKKLMEIDDALNLEDLRKRAGRQEIEIPA